MARGELAVPLLVEIGLAMAALERLEIRQATVCACVHGVRFDRASDVGYRTRQSESESYLGDDVVLQGQMRVAGAASIQLSREIDLVQSTHGLRKDTSDRR